MLDFLNRNVMHPLMAWREGSRHLEHLRVPAADAVRPAGGHPRAATRGAAGTAPARLGHRAVLPRRVGRRPAFTPSDVKSLADLEAFPILTKADIRRHERDLVSSAFDVVEASRRSARPARPACRSTIHIDEPAVQWKTACTHPLRRVERLAARPARREGVGQPRVPALRAEGPAAELLLRPRRLPRHAQPERRAHRRVRRAHPPPPAGADLRPRPLALPARVLAEEVAA